MADLNISNITIPSVATMREHLLDSNPHPQYLQHSALVTTIKSLVGIEDLRNVFVNSGLPSKSLLIYDGIGRWVNATVDELIGEAAIPDATYTVKGGVRLTTPGGVTNVDDSTTVITPNTLDAWKSGMGLVYSSNFKQMVSSAFGADPDAEFPVGLQQLSNVVITNGSSSQVLMLESWDEATHTGTFINKDLTAAKANTSTFGTVRIATESQVISGAGMTPAEMESSGYYVPSVSSVKALMGGDTFVSRVNVAGGTSTVYSSIYSNGVGGEGVTDTGYVTVVNNNGLVKKHVVSGGRLAVVDGIAIDVSAVTGFVVACLVNPSSSYNTVTSETSNIATGVVYDLHLVSSATLHVGAGGKVSGLVFEGPSAISDVRSNMATAIKYGYIKDVTIGRPMTSAEATSYVSAQGHTAQGTIYSISGVIENIVAYAATDIVVQDKAKLNDVSIDGVEAKCHVISGGYAKNIYIRPYAMLSVAAGGIVENVIAYSGATVIVDSGAIVKGFTKLPGAVTSFASGAVITYDNTKVEDMRIFSSGADYNITSDSIITFSATQHPTGVRRVHVDQSSHEVTHTFYPMAAATRVPNAVDTDYNNYTINAAGLEIWSDIHNGVNNVQWYVTF